MKVLDVAGHDADIFYVLLLCSGQYDFLPELYDVLGREKTVQLLDIFAGTTVKFPPEKELERLAAEVRIFIRIKQAGEKQRLNVIKDLADQYGLTEEVVKQVYDKTASMIEDKLGMEVLIGSLKQRRYRSGT